MVAVHGFDSRGKEWIDPLFALADNGVELHFFRWNDKQCPEAGARDLAAALRSLVAARPRLEEEAAPEQLRRAALRAMGQRADLHGAFPSPPPAGTCLRGPKDR